jgi:hypothetical protein
MEISILHIYKSNLGPSNSDELNTMDGSNLFESPSNFPYIFKFIGRQVMAIVHLDLWSRWTNNPAILYWSVFIKPVRQ